MTFDRVIASLAIPDDARVDRRVPKKLLVEQGAPTAADKRQIQDGIEEMSWIAALKPTNIAVPAFRDDVREYLEIAVLTATLRSNAKPTRLLELIHRAIPYPLVLLAAHGGAVYFSLAHKRWSQGEKGKVVIEERLPDTAISARCTHRARGIVSRKSRSLKLADTEFIRALSGMDRPHSSIRGVPDHWQIRSAGFHEAGIDLARQPEPT